MSDIDLTSPNQLKKLLREHSFYTKKRFGQNFLIDRNIVHKIVDFLDLNSNDSVLEIGPGVGTLTQEIAKRCKKVAAVEIDHDLIKLLEHTLDGCSNVEIVNGDILKTDLNSLIDKSFDCDMIKVVGNLPYYITSPIIAHIFEIKKRVISAILMVQKEVAERLIASPGSKDYGSMSVFVQYHSNVEIIANVSKNVFMPAPEVSSSIVKLAPYQVQPCLVDDEELFFKIVHSAFYKRRKTLLNGLYNSSLNISKNEVLSVLEAAGIDPERRAETISINEFSSITNHMKNIIKTEEIC